MVLTDNRRGHFTANEVLHIPESLKLQYQGAPQWLQIVDLVQQLLFLRTNSRWLSFELGNHIGTAHPLVSLHFSPHADKQNKKKHSDSTQTRVASAPKPTKLYSPWQALKWDFPQIQLKISSFFPALMTQKWDLRHQWFPSRLESGRSSDQVDPNEIGDH